MIVRVLLLVLTLAWPLLVYFGLQTFGVRALALLLLALALARAAFSRDVAWRVAAVGVLVLAAVALAGGALLPLKLYPVLVNGVLLAVFAASLYAPQTAIERLARLREPELPPQAVLYTRRVTRVWCGFFLLNGAIALWTALAGSDAQWAFYNGFLAYVLMGALFAGEWLVRRRVQAAIRHG